MIFVRKTNDILSKVSFSLLCSVQIKNSTYFWSTYILYIHVSEYNPFWSSLSLTTFDFSSLLSSCERNYLYIKLSSFVSQPVIFLRWLIYENDTVWLKSIILICRKFQPDGIFLSEATPWSFITQGSRKKIPFFSGPTTKRGGGLGPDH